MTNELSRSLFASEDAALEGDSRQLKEYINEYSNIPLFEPAHGDEVLIIGNPYRRPLRGNDHRFIDFGVRLPASELSSNTSLAANRMLLNIYDSQKLGLPSPGTGSRWEHFGVFYGRAARLLGEHIRPLLEGHVFARVESEAEAAAARGLDADFTIEAVASQCAARQQRLTQQLLSSNDLPRQLAFYVLQLAPDVLFGSASDVGLTPGSARRGSAAVDGSDPSKGTAVMRSIRHLVLAFEASGLEWEAHRYWQFYLPTALSLRNYHAALRQDHRRALRLAGARCFFEVERRLTTEALRTLLENVADERALAELERLAEDRGAEMAAQAAARSLISAYGRHASEEVLTGLNAARALWESFVNAFSVQLEWCDGISRYRDIARGLHDRMERGELSVPVESFVEQVTERSTTHVHDDHRMLVIESGSMDFWPGYGDALHLEAGDVAIVPKDMLHGSVVTSPECVYHQPLVSNEMFVEHFVTPVERP